MLYYILFNDYYTPREAVIVFLITIFVYLISLTLHEFAHSLTAYKMGDPTPKLMGRLTLNPFKHLSLGGFLMFVLLGIGWAKPVPINPLNFKRYRKGIRLVSISGILTQKKRAESDQWIQPAVTGMIFSCREPPSDSPAVLQHFFQTSTRFG